MWKTIKCECPCHSGGRCGITSCGCGMSGCGQGTLQNTLQEFVPIKRSPVMDELGHFFHVRKLEEE